MHTIELDVGRPDREPVEASERISSTIVPNVIDNIGLAMDAGLRSTYDGVGIVGAAATVKAALGDNLVIHKAVTLTESGDVFITNCDGYTNIGYVDGLMCTSCQASGLAGLITDGAYHDSREIAEAELPVYDHGVNPQGPLKQDPDSVNVTASVGDVSIDPGDIAAGDDDGLVAIPCRGAEEVLERAHEELSTEGSVREEVLKGEYLYELNGHDELFENLTIVGPENPIY